MFGKYAAMAAGYLLPIGPDNSQIVVDRYFRKNTVVLRKKTQESTKNSTSQKKTQESQIACLGSVLVTCYQ